MGFGLKMRGTPAAEIDRRVHEAARILDVEHLLERRPRQLSGGQRQRVALGRAIVREPQAFLMDEPLSNLDAKLRVHMRAEIGALHQRLGVTTIYVTHDQIEAMTMANRIVIMKDGEIQQIADPDTMFRAPANLFVAGFIGSPGMNFLKTEVADDGNCRLLGATIRIANAAGTKRDLTLGLRPEFIGIGTGPVTFNVMPVLVESLGSEKYVYFDAPGENRVAGAIQRGEEDRRGDRMIARLVNAGPVRVGEPLALSFDPAHLHIFDPASGRAIR
jgi:multiple sugar transport system ATP-binding protein